MVRLVEEVRADVVPYFDRYGTPEGFLRLCRERNQGHPNGIGDPYVLNAQAHTEVVLERYDDAIASFAKVRRVGDASDQIGAWFVEFGARADALRERLGRDPAGVRAEALANVAREKAALGLPG